MDQMKINADGQRADFEKLNFNYNLSQKDFVKYQSATEAKIEGNKEDLGDQI